jgi:hypothetical protein
MAKQKTKTELLDENVKLSMTNLLLEQCIQDLLAKDFKMKSDGAYTLHLSRLTDTVGGICMITFQRKGQRDTTHTYYLDHFLDMWGTGRASSANNEDAQSVHRLADWARVERQRAYDKEIESEGKRNG